MGWMAVRGRAGSSTPATTALARAGAAFTVHSFVHDPTVPSYGLEAAQAIGVPAERVFKTLVAEVDGGLVVAIVPVSTSLDLKALASARGGKRAALASPAAAVRATGYVAGGTSPLGQRRRLPTVLDITATDFATVFVSAGRRGLDLELAADDLIRLTGASTAPIGRTG